MKCRSLGTPLPSRMKYSKQVYIVVVNSDPYLVVELATELPLTNSSRLSLCTRHSLPTFLAKIFFSYISRLSKWVEIERWAAASCNVKILVSFILFVSIPHSNLAPNQNTVNKKFQVFPEINSDLIQRIKSQQVL